ncbi:MAG: type I-A CRISPR-associated protein Cas7/Csa2 [Thermoproteota archaeon]
MRHVWMSLAWRSLINIEALNMAESIGNYVKHRRAPVAYFDEESGNYVIKYVPVISGESLAHAYQTWLAEEAIKRGLKVCKYCEKGELTKHGARIILKEEGIGEDVKEIDKAKEVEVNIIENCVVEDIGGFLMPTTFPVKRTSRVYVGYMIPAADSIKVAVMDPQFHVRHAPSLIGRSEEFPEKGQAIYYVETGTAVYTASFVLDLSGIGYTSMFEIRNVISEDERLKRTEAALFSVYYLLVGMFGAKQTRFMPNYKLLSAVASVSFGTPFNVDPGHDKNYVEKTVARASAFREITGSKVSIFAYAAEELNIPSNGVNRAETPEDLVKSIVSTVLEFIKK